MAYYDLENHLIRICKRFVCNGHTSGSGYLAIPLSITRLFPSALNNYGPLLESECDLISSIELAPTDGIFAEKFGSSLPETIRNRKDILFIVNPMEQSLFISINGIDSNGFPINEIKTEDIIEYINSANDKKVAFIIEYDIHGKELCDKWPHEPYGCLIASGDNYIKGGWKFMGPEKTKDTL